ncbi:MAG: hypothetical protein JWM80_4930 [Cyanobacteria bacterium RYN_339]|nr:hypothetical protein [Cyanobacteria bacterium RYN_339]
MLTYEAVEQSSREMHGGLGAIAYAVLKGLEAGGADAEAVAGTRDMLFAHFAKLSDADCNVLCQVVASRLAADRQPDGNWY